MRTDERLSMTSTPPSGDYGNYPPAPPASQGYPAAPPASGYPAAPGYGSYPPVAKTNTLAVVSLISAIAGMVIIPFIASVVAVITGHMSLGQLKQSGEQGRGLALAGTIIGWVGIGLSVLSVILLLAFLPLFLAAIDGASTMS